MRRALVILAAVLCMGAASDPAETLKDPKAEAKARKLFAEVRCLVCQNESIDDSEAPLAADLRRIVREQIASGRSESEIRTYLVDRYGEFVMFRPAMTLGNAALWFTPLALVLLGGVLWISVLRRREATPALTAEEEARLAALSEDAPS